ncbi:unnamed protein product [Lasius platythorax]|uniref:Uncharacterized protein n=1 Tax=Lasius platythorax TaxID=488582 RepID=A0AAV2N0F7_9HYME
MFEIFTEDTSSNKDKNNSEEHLSNVMSGHTNEAFRIDNKECEILNNEIEYNDVKPVTTSLEGRAEPFSRHTNIMYCRNQYKSYRENCTINIADTVEIYPSPQTLEENVLKENTWLDDRPLNEIMKIIENNTLFHRVDVLFITGLHWVEPIFNPDVQIVGGRQAGNHWHCIYYDGVKVHIYDSLYFATHSYDNLTLFERNYIKKRYPNLTQNNVIFEKVTKQPDLATGDIGHRCQSGLCGGSWWVAAAMGQVGQDPVFGAYGLTFP